MYVFFNFNCCLWCQMNNWFNDFFFQFHGYPWSGRSACRKPARRSPCGRPPKSVLFWATAPGPAQSLYYKYFYIHIYKYMCGSLSIYVWTLYVNIYIYIYYIRIHLHITLCKNRKLRASPWPKKLPAKDCISAVVPQASVVAADPEWEIAIHLYMIYIIYI